MSTNTPQTAGAKPTPSSGPWPRRAALAAGAAGVLILGIVIGRLSNPGGSSAPTSASHPASSGSGAVEATGEPVAFNLTERPDFKSGVPLREMDCDIFALLQSLKLERTQMRDVFPDRPYKVTFVGSIAERRIGLVMIDLNRDGTIDERWDLKKGGVMRMVPKDPGANGQQVTYSLAHGRWQPH